MINNTDRHFNPNNRHEQVENGRYMYKPVILDVVLVITVTVSNTYIIATVNQNIYK